MFSTQSETGTQENIILMHFDADVEVLRNLFTNIKQSKLDTCSLVTNSLGNSILHVLIDRFFQSKNITDIIILFYTRLSIENRDQLMQARNNEGITPFAQLMTLPYINKRNEEIDQLFTTLISSTSPLVIDKLAKSSKFDALNSLHGLIVFNRSALFINTLMSVLQDETKEHLALMNDKIGGMNLIIAFIAYHHKKLDCLIYRKKILIK